MGLQSTRVSRYWSKLRGRNRSSRPKTFKTEEAAKAYAKKEGIENFTLENLRGPGAKVGKFRILIQVE